MSKKSSQLGFIAQEDQTEEIDMTDESQQAVDPFSQEQGQAVTEAKNGAQEEEKKESVPSKSERTMYHELYTRASTAEQVLDELGYKVYIGAPHSDQYGVLR